MSLLVAQAAHAEPGAMVESLKKQGWLEWKATVTYREDESFKTKSDAHITGEGLSGNGGGERVETKHHEADLTARAMTMVVKGMRVEFHAGGRDADRTIEIKGSGPMKHVVSDDSVMVGTAVNPRGSATGHGVKRYTTDENGWLKARQSEVSFLFDEQKHHWNVVTTFNYTRQGGKEEHSHGDAAADGLSGSKDTSNFEKDDAKADDGTSLNIDERNGKLTREGDRYVIDYTFTENKVDNPLQPDLSKIKSNEMRNAIKDLPAIQGLSKTVTHEHRVTAHIVVEPAGKSEDVELVVEPIGHGSKGAVPYEAWIPEATDKEEMEGSWVELKATLRTTSGAPIPLDHRAVTFSFELVEVSKQPGVAMNYPLIDAKTTPDLSFLGIRHAQPGASFTRFDTTAASVGSPEASANVYCFDWGAFGTVKVSAHLVNGDVVVGHLKGASDTTRILLPKRTEPSLIADAWKKSMGVSGVDLDDEEAIPAGDGTTGDGLTLYEEYRGFYQGTGRALEHITGDPLRKDLFVKNLLGPSGAAGIELLAGRTGLAVHHQAAVLLQPSTDVVNFNHDGETPRRGDQHGVELVAAVAGAPDCSAHLAHVTPAKPGPGKAAADAANVAHALGKCVHMTEHGDGDYDATWERQPGADGTVVIVESRDGAQPMAVRVLNEDGTPVAPEAYASRTALRVGVRGGASSGVEACFMRSVGAQAYVGADADVRYLVRDAEAPGNELCSAATGTGVNAPGRRPQPRYGDAQRGDCLHQVCVNDTKPCRAP
jgi:hypothetical protein